MKNLLFCAQISDNDVTSKGFNDHIKDIFMGHSFYSMKGSVKRNICEDHLQPFFGTLHNLIKVKYSVKGFDFLCRNRHGILVNVH